MAERHRIRRWGLRYAAGLLGVAAVTAGLAGPAGASSFVPAANHLIIGSGSNTTYLMMIALGDIFNESPGCDLAAPSGSTQNLNFVCGGNNTDGENGLGNGTQNAAWTTVAAGSNGVSLPTSTIDVASTANFVSPTWSGGNLLVWIGGTDVEVSCAGSEATAFTGCTGGTGTLATGQEVSTVALGGDGQNPYDDVVVEEPPLGSSNGIKELDQHGTNAAPVDFARSSRAPNNTEPNPTGDPVDTSAGDPTGLNFVAYAEDAVPWLHWTAAPAAGDGPCTEASQCVATPSAGIHSLSIPVLSEIYNGEITNWDQICAHADSTCPVANNDHGGTGTAGPIDVYMAQNGSGTEGTWATVLGLTSATPAGVTDPATHVIFENEIASILVNKDEADAIFYMSYGKFNTGCTPAPAQCGSATTGVGSAMTLGNETIAVNGTPIIPSVKTINSGTFPTDRYLYNVYADGSNSAFPATDQAALNFMGEDGFICKESPSLDSNTGKTYANMIRKTIENFGFYPLPSRSIYPTQSGGTAGSLTANPAVVSDPAYHFVDPGFPTTNGGTHATTGHCEVFTTDGDGVS